MSENNRSSRREKVLTTGQVARVCNVAPRTVSKWFDTGQLRGYRIPGSRDRRIPLDQLLRFMKAHNMPLNGLDAGPRRVLLIHADPDLARTIAGQLDQSGFTTTHAEHAIEAGMMLERIRPHVVVVDLPHDELDPAVLAAVVRRETQFGELKLVALCEPNDSQYAHHIRRSFDGRVDKPFGMPRLLDVLGEVLGTPATNLASATLSGVS